MPLSLPGRLLCASTQAYSIRGAGPVADTLPPPNPPRSALVGYVGPVTGFDTGADLIDAGLVAVAADSVIVAFRGTFPPGGPDVGQVVLDWANDADAPLLPGAGLPGLVHQGFLDALDALWPTMLPAIEAAALAVPGKPIYVTGHSKGGAMAFLAAYRIKTALPGAQVVVRSFAAARAGDAAFAAAYDAALPDTLRYEYADDIVPHLPPGDVLIAALKDIPFVGGVLGGLTVGYISAGQLQYIASDGSIQADSPALKDSRIKNLVNRLRAFDFQTIADDHSISLGSGYAGAICPGD